MIRLWLVLLPLILSGCASQTLVHKYKGDVQLQSLVVNIESLTLDGEVARGKLSKIADIQRIVQAIKEAQDEDKTARLVAQLQHFEEILVAGIRDASGVPLVADEPLKVDMKYGQHNELTSIVYTYPQSKKDFMTLEASIVYPSKSSTSIGFVVGGKETFTVTPQMDLTINGFTRKGENFWYQNVTFKSRKDYTVGNNYVLGVATDRIEDAEIFLIPMAEGTVKRLKADMRKK